jgi:hypothetical protein
MHYETQHTRFCDVCVSTPSIVVYNRVHYKLISQSGSLTTII